MDVKNVSVEFAAKIKPIKPINEQFTLCKVYVLALGKNRNGSVITKEAADDALPTIFNIPIVGHLYADSDGELHMGGHDITIEKDANGEYKFVQLTVPYGTVYHSIYTEDGSLEANEVLYEDIEEPDGTVRPYMSINAVLWTGRYPELLESIYNENTYWGQSMEIIPLELVRNKEDKEYMDIRKFQFSALCLLGASDDPEFHVEPCFPEAKVEPFKYALDDNFSQQFEEMKKELALCFSNQKQEKEVNLLDEDKNLNASNPQDVDSFNNDESDINNIPDDISDSNVGDGSTNEEFALTYKDKTEQIYNALSALNVNDGETAIYYNLCDYDDKFVYVEKEWYNRNSGYGSEKARMGYNVVDNKIVIDAESYEQVFVRWLTKAELDELDKINAELSELRTYKLNSEKAIKMQKLEAVLEEFPDLKNDAEFKEITEKLDEFDSEDALKEKLFAIRGKKMAFSLKRESKPKVKFPIDLNKIDDVNEDPYAGFMEKYSKKIRRE